jgi:hypothetical protein
MRCGSCFLSQQVFFGHWAIGFEVPEIDLLIDGLNTVAEADPDDLLTKISESAVSVPGDLWRLGKHRVLCGNALIITDYDRHHGWRESRPCDQRSSL